MSRLEELATVGVRDGTTLVVIVFDPQVCCCCCAARYQFRPSAPSGLASAVRDLYLNVELTHVCCWMCWMCMWRGRTIWIAVLLIPRSICLDFLALMIDGLYG